MGKSKIPPVDNTDPSQFSQINANPSSDLQAIRDHLLLVISWNGLHEQMNLDKQSKEQSDDINKDIERQ
ncbi:MAG: hypothetical protein KBC64_02115 [Simkaniaceae bacterium]|nr:hypothetical protein [Simkaniaceae bacterium]